MDENLFEVLTPLGFRVHTTRSYWDLVSTIKHPVMSGHVPEVKECLAEPDYVRQSRMYICFIEEAMTAGSARL